MPQEPPPVTRAAWPPATDHAPESRCPVCGRGDCPESAHPRADWIVLVVALLAISAAVGWVLYWLAFEDGLAVIMRGLGGLLP